jgi:outer membrane lipoprotein-sorting protein
MAGLPDLIGLLYRADWTRLSLSAELRAEYGQEPLPPPSPLPRPRRKYRSRWYRDWPGQRQDNGRYVGHGALLIGPGGRWRLVCPDPGLGAGGEAAEGNDGEHVWSWRPLEMGGSAPLPVRENGTYLPVPELLCPSRLLGGYTLEELGPVTVARRDAIAVAATPRRDALGPRPAQQAYDRIEVAVDAELGILLRRIETSAGELVTLTELTDVTMNPPEAADPARFAPRPGSHLGDTRGEKPAVSGPGWAAADLAFGGLGALVRHLPHRPGHGAAAEQPEAMPSPDPASLEPAGGSPPPDEVLELLYRSGEPRILSATVRQWLDFAAIARPMSEEIGAAGGGGFASLVDTATRAMNVTRTEARLRVSGPDRYRLDYSARPRPVDATTISCDGERSWRVYQDRTLVGPATPLREPIVSLAESSWLLRLRLSGGAELTYRGRPARQLRVTSPGGEHQVPGLLMSFPADAIVDAETGCLLRLLCYADDTLAIWSELDDISTEPIDPDEFRVHVPPGTRTVEQTGNLITDAVAAIPGVKGTAARAAAEAVNRTADAVSAARSFLDDLRGHR